MIIFFEGVLVKIIYLLFIYLSLSASVITIQYVGEFSFFGKVGEATLEYNNDGEKYHIKISGTGTGIVGDLTQHKLYVYESLGLVKDNKLIPMKYIATETGQDLNKTKIYTFDYENNKTIITQHKKENKEESQYNIFTFDYDTSTKLVEENSTKILDKVYKDDMVSVFFNKRNNLLYMKQGETKLVEAVGSDDTQDGVIIRFIEKKDDKYMYRVTVKKEYLEGGSEDVTLILDSNNVLFETKVDGILFFGNAKVRRN
jgi:hypothetical protein